MAKKKYRKMYSTGNRVDMSNGGRVGYQIGKMVEEPEKEEMSVDNQETLNLENTENTSEETTSEETTSEETTPATSQMNVGFGAKKATTASEERTDRIAESAARIQEGAEGKVPDSAVIEGISSDKGTKVDENIKGTTVVKQEEQT